MFNGGGTLNRLASLGADEPSLLAFAHHNGIHADEESILRLIVATSRCPFRAKDGVLLNVECFGPAYKGGDEPGNTVASQNNGDTAYNHTTHRRSIHNSDQWPLVSN